MFPSWPKWLVHVMVAVSNDMRVYVVKGEWVTCSPMRFTHFILIFEYSMERCLSKS